MDADDLDDPDRDVTDLEAALGHLMANARPFARDTRLPPNIIAQYTVGRLLRERAFCDASYRIAGLVAPHRFLIISAEAAVLDETVGPRRGLCVLRNNAYLKVIDHTTRGDRTQVTLLHLPDSLLGFFSAPDLNPLENRFVELARASFADCLGREPVPELDTDGWRQRLEFPLGFDDDGRPWPLSGDEEPLPDDEDGEAAPIFAAGDTVTCDNDLRHGDRPGTFGFEPLG